MPLNNERALRRVHEGDSGASIAGLYSLVAACEAHGINPFDYLSNVRARAGSPRRQ